MADTHPTPGIALIFGEEIWLIPADNYEDVTRKIEQIKEAVVGPSGTFGNTAKKLTKGDYVALAELETEDIKSLLTKGITIRPMGR
ncbi:MAG: hypothetical protein HKP56_06200 [Anderseniella sp.]|nr:hypothetical protein [Anderseniella sp.]